ncbi:MAG: hypothetical protein REI11_19130 [Patulibacter sp.]|nr:hypothetical protein [Patulibacter sp.]
MSGGPAASRHPLCTCPELTWDMLTGRAEAPDRQACRDRSPFVDTHPVLTPADIERVTAAGRASTGSARE